jgi:hypothetical protein
MQYLELIVGLTLVTLICHFYIRGHFNKPDKLDRFICMFLGITQSVSMWALFVTCVCLIVEGL